MVGRCIVWQTHFFVLVPTIGTLAPTGNYYVTIFLMMEKQVTTTDENGQEKVVSGLASIGRQQFTEKVSYKNDEEQKRRQTSH